MPVSGWARTPAGTTQQIGNAYEWRHTSGLGVQIVVTASERDGRTRLRFRQLVGLASPAVEGVGYGLIIATVLGSFGSGLASWTALGALTAFLMLWAASAMAVTVFDRRWRARKLRELDALADDVGEILAAPPREAASAAPAARDAPETLLDLDALGDAPPATETPDERRRQRAG